MRSVRSVRRLGSSLLATFVLAGALPAAAESDGSLQARIEKRFEGAKLYQAAELRVEVRDGVAYLDGAATTLAARREAERRARKEVKVVHNRVRVVPEPRSDAEILAEAERQVLGYVYYGIFDSVELGVQDGIVYVQGSVYQPYRKDDILERLEHVRGVRAIRNDLRVQSVSTFDERLRHQLARAIYGDERLVQYGLRSNPPIHIVVDKGHVTLTGYVASRVEQALIGHIARQALAFSVDNRLRVDGQDEKERGMRAGG